MNEPTIRDKAKPGHRWYFIFDAQGKHIGNAPGISEEKALARAQRHYGPCADRAELIGSLGSWNGERCEDSDTSSLFHYGGR